MTCPVELIHLYFAVGLLVALHTTDRDLPSTIDILLCDDVLNVGRSRSVKKELHAQLFFQFNRVNMRNKLS